MFLRAVIAALVQERPRTPAELVERLATRESSPGTSPPTHQPPAIGEPTTQRRNWLSWGGRGRLVGGGGRSREGLPASTVKHPHRPFGPP